tara:strand:- start:757 stop:1008 length:252 start_codon:yes stop_codon:yes gene_type:complete
MSQETMAFWLMDYIEREFLYRLSKMDEVKSFDKESLFKEQLGILKGVLQMANWLNGQSWAWDKNLLDEKQSKRLKDLIKAANK